MKAISLKAINKAKVLFDSYQLNIVPVIAESGLCIDVISSALDNNDCVCYSQLKTLPLEK